MINIMQNSEIEHIMAAVDSSMGSLLNYLHESGVYLQYSK